MVDTGDLGHILFEHHGEPRPIDEDRHCVFTLDITTPTYHTSILSPLLTDRRLLDMVLCLQVSLHFFLQNSRESTHNVERQLTLQSGSFPVNGVQRYGSKSCLPSRTSSMAPT